MAGFKQKKSKEELNFAPFIQWTDIPTDCNQFAIDYGKSTGMELSWGKDGNWLGKGRFHKNTEYENVFKLVANGKGRIVAESSFGSYDLEDEYNLFYSWAEKYNVNWSGYRAKLTEVYRRNHVPPLPKLNGQDDSEQESNYIFDIVFKNNVTTRKFYKKIRDSNTGYINSEGYVPESVVKSLNMAIEKTKGVKAKGSPVQKLLINRRVMKSKSCKCTVPENIKLILINDLFVKNIEGQNKIFNAMLTSSAAIRAATAALYCHEHKGTVENGMNVGTIDFHEKLVQTYGNRKGGKVSSEIYRHVSHTVADLVVKFSDEFNDRDSLIKGHSVEMPLKNKVLKLTRKFFKNFIYDETKVLVKI